MYYPDHMYFSPFSFIGPVISFLFWIFIILFVIRLIRRKKMGDWHGMWRGGGGAMGTLRERYAKGEISKEEYEERKKVLEQR